ncbi:response regulator [Paenibacillus senegalensis]|uniref:response regulator n=1 Tax=Paenibacillus senegalensis TaxID=1465766 RepID=UPI000474651B|nr:response regulator [Paenibacillus senegalensis]
MEERIYRVLLVDDEPIIIESLKVAIPWSQWGMEIVGEARNGQDALTAADRLLPDVIISDIRMPVIDGITFMRNVMAAREEKKLKEPLFIVVSGYGEFDYAREALRHGAFDYILKPIDHDELEKIIEKAKLKLDDYHLKRIEEEKLRISVQRLSETAKERLYSEMMDGQAPSPLLQLGIELDPLEAPYFLMLIQLDPVISGGWAAEEKRLRFFAIDNILKEVAAQNEALAVFPYYSGEWVLLFAELPADNKRLLGGKIVHALETNAKLLCSVGISSTCIGFSHLNLCYQHAVKALHHRFHQTAQKVFIYEEQFNAQELPSGYPASIEKRLVDAVRTLHRPGISQALEQLGEQLVESAATRETAKRILFEMAVIVHRQLDFLPSVPGAGLNAFYDRLEEEHTLQGMIRVLELSLAKWVELACNLRSQESGPGLIEKAKRYIDAHYQHDIGIEEVAEHVEISFSYFCTLFKQTAGCTFLEYLTRFRIGKACQLLRESEVKVFQIASLVGYQDPRYFTQVFKKMMGMTPSEYREQQGPQAVSS